MKFFVLSDEDKRITTPDSYLMDSTPDGRMILWDPYYLKYPIEISTILGIPHDLTDLNSQFRFIQEHAKKSGLPCTIMGEKAVMFERMNPDQIGKRLHWYNVGLGNSIVCFSISLLEADENRPEVLAIKKDLEGMIESLVSRKPGESFNCELLESERNKIEVVFSQFQAMYTTDDFWSVLRDQYDLALEKSDAESIVHIGEIFGEMLRANVPGLKWRVIVADFGRARSLNFGKGISLFPESMIMKRFDRKERFNLEDLASNTIEAIDKMVKSGNYIQPALPGSYSKATSCAGPYPQHLSATRCITRPYLITMH